MGGVLHRDRDIDDICNEGNGWTGGGYPMHGNWRKQRKHAYILMLVLVEGGNERKGRVVGFYTPILCIYSL